MHVAYLAHRKCSTNGSYYYTSSHLIIKIGRAFGGNFVFFFPYQSIQICARLLGSHDQVFHRGVCLPGRGFTCPGASRLFAPLLGLPLLALFLSFVGAAEIISQRPVLPVTLTSFQTISLFLSLLSPHQHAAWTQAHTHTCTQSHSHVLSYMYTDAHNNRESFRQ